jgi:hypothetical protein
VAAAFAKISGLDIWFEMLDNIRQAIADHEVGDCDSEPKAILMNPGNFQLIGWDEAFGLPVLPDPKVEPMTARLVCGVGRAGVCEEGEVRWDEEGRPYVFHVSAEGD